MENNEQISKQSAKKNRKPRRKNKSYPVALANESIRAFIAGSLPYACEAIKIVLAIDESKDKVSPVTDDEIKVLNKYMNQGLCEGDNLTESTIRNHRGFMAMKLVAKATPFIKTKERVATITMMLMMFSYKEKYVKEAFNKLVPSSQSSEESSASSSFTLPPLTGVVSGVYYVYIDGTFNLVDDELLPGRTGADVKGIGVKFGEYSFIVSKKDVNKGIATELTKDKDNGEIFYLDSKDVAVADYDGVANTKDMGNHLSDNIELADGEYIPSLGEMSLIYINLETINKAMDKVGGDRIKEECYWSSTQFSKEYAWYINLANGYASSFAIKACNTYCVRPVSVFLCR